jgi:predicted AlkP superfamily phosphohydrolase/phosphomutase
MVSSKLLVVGWDGATFDLLDPWMAAGELPNLARLMQEGVRGPMLSVPNMNSGPAWTSVMTGVNPGKHGIYGLVTFAEDSYRMRPLNASDRHVKTIWQRLSVAGKRVVVVNAPMTYPAEAVNGVLVAGGDAPSSRSPGFTYPETLIDELNAEVGEYIMAARLDGLIRAGRRAEALDRLHRMVEARAKATLHLMRKQPWDICFVLFVASDSVQHFFWKDLTGGRFQDAILDVYRHMDEALGSLLAQADEQTNVVVLSDHGCGPTQVSLRYLNGFLAGLGLLRYNEREDSRVGLQRWAFLQLEKRLGDGTKEWLVQRFPRLYQRAVTGLWYDNIDWSATRAFSKAGSSEIWINQRDRLPEGIVSPGREYEEVVNLIQRAVGGAVEPTTGEPAVKAVHRGGDLYHGPFVDRAPDLLVEWTETPVRTGLAWYGEGQEVVSTRSYAFRRHPVNGGHKRMGMWGACGPAFRRGTRVEGACLYDVAPTLLYLLDQPIPSSFDGRLLDGGIERQWLQDHLPQYEDDPEDTAPGLRVAIPSADEEKVMGRLRGLGYVE